MSVAITKNKMVLMLHYQHDPLASGPYQWYFLLEIFNDQNPLPGYDSKEECQIGVLSNSTEVRATESQTSVGNDQ